MELQRFIGLLSALVGVMGAVFLAKGVLASSPKDILNTFHQYSHIAYPSVTQIASKSGEKSSTLLGITLVLLAFLMQAITLMIKINMQRDWLSLRLLVWIGLIIFGVSCICDLAIFNLYKKRIGRLAVKDYCTSRFERERVDPVNVRSLESITSELLSLRKGEAESTEHFVRRVAEYVKWQVPNHINFSVLDSEEVKKK